jgi:hypothetical protein
VDRRSSANSTIRVDADGAALCGTSEAEAVCGLL